jgi:uncharacterized protein (DUF1800 family)
MAIDLKNAAIAAHRFGLGPRAGTLAELGPDPRAVLIAELRPGLATVTDANLLSASEARRALFRRAEATKAEQPNQRPADKNARAARNPSQASGMDAADESSPNQLLVKEAQARFDTAFDRKVGFVERLVWFWSNHFCISTEKSVMRPLAGPFEREAIRPHVLGKFVDMLIAVERHPAMLTYLDNIRSIGPRSAAAAKATAKEGKGLNENLAREILELHTLGVRTVYSQADVTSLAKIITGWTVSPRQNATGGEFVFEAQRHEPGPQTVLGKSYRDTGVDQGMSALRDIAAHPATARHVSVKFARHFIADEPPASLVDLLATRFQETGGDLKEMAVALVTWPEALSAPRTKLKRPTEWLTGMWRVSEVGPSIVPALRQLAALGEPLWRPPAPKGFPDDSPSWGSGIGTRLDIANEYAMGLDKTIDAREILEFSLGPLASAETRRAIGAADSQAQAMALLFMSPEFLRR